MSQQEPGRSLGILVFGESNIVIDLVKRLLNSKFYNIYSASSFSNATNILEFSDINLVIILVEPAEMSGLDFIHFIKRRHLQIAIVATSTNEAPSIAAAAVRAGATDFLRFPFNQERLLCSIEHSLGKLLKEKDSNNLTHPIYDENEYGFIGASQSMLEVSKLIISAAKTDASVFITGENGTGKDVCAQLIHRLSRRHHHDMVPLNCAAIPQALAESALFGHTKGSFTNAHDAVTGLVRAAHKGSLFLDELGEMDIELQAKLLRFVQTGTFNRVGSTKLEQVDVRLICSTNRDPLEQIANSTFREDLYYRLNVIQIHLPPLRNRGDDLLVFANNFLRNFSISENKHFDTISPETEALLANYTWPGNVRELQNVMRCIVVLHDGESVIPSMLPQVIINQQGNRRRASDLNDPQVIPTKQSHKTQNPLIKTSLQVSKINQKNQIIPLDTIIRDVIENALTICNGNVVEAAANLGVSPSTIYRKQKRKVK